MVETPYPVSGRHYGGTPKGPTISCVASALSFTGSKVFCFLGGSE